MNLKILYNTLLSLIGIFLLAVAARTFVFEPFFVPTGSMKPGLLEGDYIFATKHDYGYSHYSISIPIPWGIGDKIFKLLPKTFHGRKLAFNTPQRGDIVIFAIPKIGERYIKRLIGLPGDKVQVINGLLYINDRLVERQHIEKCHVSINDKFYPHDEKDLSARQAITYNKSLETLPNGVQYHVLNMADTGAFSSAIFNFANNTPPFYVPNRKYFFMGDNRDNSNDSRLGIGFIDEEYLIGKAHFIYFSTSEPLWVGKSALIQIKQIWKWVTGIRWSRFFQGVDS